MFAQGSTEQASTSEELSEKLSLIHIFALFFENKGRILTRGQILSGIWDESGNFVNNNTLTVYIKSCLLYTSKIDEDCNHWRWESRV